MCQQLDCRYRYGKIRTLNFVAFSSIHMLRCIFVKICFRARKPVFEVCEKQRRRPACTSMQSDQRLCNSLIGIIFRLGTSIFFLIFLLVSVAEETGLSLALSKTPKTGFLTQRPNYHFMFHSGQTSCPYPYYAGCCMHYTSHYLFQ